MKFPRQYKTQRGLIKALNKVSEGLLFVRTAVWLRECVYSLVDNFGWEEMVAEKFVACYYPSGSGYLATG